MMATMDYTIRILVDGQPLNITHPKPLPTASPTEFGLLKAVQNWLMDTTVTWGLGDITALVCDGVGVPIKHWRFRRVTAVEPEMIQIDGGPSCDQVVPDVWTAVPMGRDHLPVARGVQFVHTISSATLTEWKEAGAHRVAVFANCYHDSLHFFEITGGAARWELIS